MDRRRRVRPVLEAMEPRQLLATIALVGSGRGVERTVSMVGKIATIARLEHSLSGVVRIEGRGRFRVSAGPAGPSAIILSNAAGTLVFAESGVPTAGADHLTLVAGTGAYGGDQGGGEMTLILGRSHTSTRDTRSAETTTTVTQHLSIRVTPPPG